MAVAIAIGVGRGATAAEPAHWAFKAPVRPAVPAAATSVQNPIDRFLLLALRKKGLTYSPPADRRTLLRRVTVDLIGLPPSVAELDAFLADRSANAYDKVVDRLLADPRFGERWARHWLDTAGYADSEGILQEDRVRPNAWRYRDYVIRSLNADKPYDRFLREQIAGDEVVDFHGAAKWSTEIEDPITATGFLRTAVDATRDDFNTHQYSEYQVRMLNDTQTILVSTTLGITLQCARCHDHKLEPFTQRDYYRMQAFLAGAIRPDGKLLPTDRRQIPAATDGEQKRAAENNAAVDAEVKVLDAEAGQFLTQTRIRYLGDKRAGVAESDLVPLIAAVRIAESQRSPAQNALVAKYKAQTEATSETLAAAFTDFKERSEKIRKARAEAESRRIVVPEIRAIYDQDANAPQTRVRIRGEWTRPGDPVDPGVPAVLDDPGDPFRLPAAPPDAKTTGRRHALADWITRPGNPLTARVIVNRLWSHHFGVGLVATPENFGRSGAKPTNQALLDWLACCLTQGIDGAPPWTLKSLHRLMVTSAAYRQSSAYRADAGATDPDNRLLWRQRTRRLEAEALRDSVLFAAGSLDGRMFGAPVDEETRPTGEIVPAGEDKHGRRSIYLLVRRSMPVTLLNTFDAPIMETNCTRRVTSATATQALAVLNSAFFDSQARNFAQRVRKESVTSRGVEGLVETAYRIALSRLPTPAERAAALSFLSAQSARYRGAEKPAVPANSEEMALADLCLALLGSNEFAYVD